MTVTSRPLFAANYASDTETAEYTCGAGTRAIIDKLTAYSAAGGSLTVKLVPNGGAAGAANVIAVKTLAANEAYTFPEVVGHVLEAGGVISVIAAVANTVVIRASGREVT